MQTYLTTNELSRRLGIARSTLLKRLQERGVSPAAIVINGSKTPGPLFDAEQLPALRTALATTEKPQ